MEYHKIQTVWLRDPDNRHKTLLPGQWATPEFRHLCDAEWIWTEKVDGTNIRVMWDGETVTFGGKTDRAQIPPKLVERLTDMFPADRMKLILGDGKRCILYGEGFGGNIQKAGKLYDPQAMDFVLFDIVVLPTSNLSVWWLSWDNVRHIGDNLNVKVVPLVGRGDLLEAINAVSNDRVISAWGNFPAEGLVMRPAVDLFDRSGKRIIAKVKRKDFERGKTS